MAYFVDRFSGAVRAFVVAIVAAVAVLACAFVVAPAKAYADIAMPDSPNEANLVLVVRFSDQTDRDTYNTTVVGSRSSWQSTMDAFNTDFKNYVGTVSRGKLNAKSLFPQDNNGTLEYLDLDISSTYFTGLDNDLYLRDSKIVEAAAKAFNAKYSNWDASQANLDGEPTHIDNIMILVDTDLDVTTGLRSNMNRLSEGYTFGNLPMQDVEVIHATRAGANLGGSIDAVPAHEYLHRLGAKDLYRNGGTAGIGELVDGWDMMATARPSLLPLAQTASDMGFLTINTVASSTGTYEFDLGTYMSDDTSKPHAVAIKSPLNGSEYFVLEYRQGNLSAVGGYTADRYMGGKLSYDTSGAYDGVVISRVNTATQDKSNGAEDYLYVFRPGDSCSQSLGGDGKADTYKNASITAGGSFGSSAISDGIEQNALCYTDGTNSRIVVTVESAGNGSAKVKVTIPDYSDQSPWTAEKGTDGSSSFQVDSVVSTSLVAIGDKLWGIASGNWGAAKLITSNGEGWSLRDDFSDSILGGASIIEHNGNPVIAGVTDNYKSAIAKIYDGSKWIEKKVAVSANSARAFSCDGHLFLAVLTTENTALIYNVDNDPMQVGGALSGVTMADVRMFDSTHIAVSDLSTISMYTLTNNAWVQSNSVAFSARIISVASVGEKKLLFAESGSYGGTGQLYEISNGALVPVDCNIDTGSSSAQLSTDGSVFYLNVLDGSSNLTMYSSNDGHNWAQLGDVMKSVGRASSMAFLAGKGYVLTSAASTNTVSLHMHAPAPAAGFYEVGDYKSVDGDTVTCTAPERYGYAFAGWYADESCAQAYEGTTGSAYARFVPVSGLVRYQGASLMDDCLSEFGYDRSTIRFCYGFDVPVGCSFSSAGWDWSASWNGATGSAPAENRWLSGGDGAIANIAMVKIARKNYGKSCGVRGYVSYSTPDGTQVTAYEGSYRDATVQGVASAIASGGAGSQGEKNYASVILK